jgi:hypothetical protein
MAAELVQLAQLAAQTVVAAASTDAWAKAKEGFVRLLGRGDPVRAGVAERRLEKTQADLAALPPADLDSARAAMVRQWETRLADLLEEDPGAAGSLRELVSQIREQLPAAVVSAVGHSVAAGRNMTIAADRGAVAAAVIHGNVAPPGPTGPGLASS